jgi:hypothetical protein
VGACIGKAHSTEDRRSDFAKNIKRKLVELSASLDRLHNNGWEGNFLEHDVDFTVATYTIAGNPAEIVDIEGAFGRANNPSSLQTCCDKMTTNLENHYKIVKTVFNEADGFTVSNMEPIKILGNAGQTRTLVWAPIYVTSKTIPSFKTQILNGSGNNYDGQPIKFPSDFFGSSVLLQYQIDEFIQKDIQKNALLALHEVNEIKTNSSGKKTGMAFGMSFGIDKHLLKKDKDFGLYIGEETFFEINPSKLRIKDSFEIKSNSIGITPLFGIASKNKWAIYGLLGIRYSFKNFKILKENKKSHKNKVEYDIGIGTTYDLSKRFNLSFRYIYTPVYSVKIRDEQKIKMRISRIVLSLAYVFGE